MEFEFNKKVFYKGKEYYCKLENHKSEILIEKSEFIPEIYWGELWIAKSKIKS